LASGVLLVASGAFGGWFRGHTPGTIL
jgi:hypothetical protein